MSRFTSIIVADDHPIVREGVVALLSTQPHLRVVATAANFVDLWEVLRTTRTDVVVLDIGNMGAPPIETVERLTRAYPQLAIIVFSSSVDLAPELLRAGARGYMVKEDLTTHLLTAIREVQHERRFLSPQAQEYLERCQTQPGPQRFTRQELHVLKLLHQGQSTHDIAEALGIDVGTVYNYVFKLKTKTGCHDRIQLVDWYRRCYGPEQVA